VLTIESFFMRTLILSVALLLGAGSLSARENTASRINLGLNLAPLYSGLPEVQVDYFFSRFIGVSGSAGYVNRARRGGIKVDDNCVVTDARGAYFKVGLKGRYVSPTKKAPVPWAQLLYVYSNYDEQGYYEVDLGFPNEYHHYQGSSNGFVASIGADFTIWQRLDFRAGFQAGLYYHREEYFGIKANTFQPGIGAVPGVLIIGLNCRIGKMALPAKHDHHK
jgi:hypothetical protein